MPSLLAVLLLTVVVARAGQSPLQVDAGSLTAQIVLDPWHLSFTDPSGETVLSEDSRPGSGPSGPLGFRTPDGWAHATHAVSSDRDGDAVTVVLETSDPLGRRIEARILPDADGVIAVEARVVSGPTGDVTALGIGFRAEAEERFLGFGERNNAIDQRGNVVENYVADGPYQPEERPFVAAFVPPPGFRARDDATYYPVPWLLSSRGHGVLVDNPETSYFRLATDRPDAWSLEVVGAPEVVDAPEGLPSQPAPERLRFRVFAGPTPAGALRRFTEITGRQPAPAAPWVFGPWFQPGGSLDDTLAQIEKLRAADAPVSVAQTYRHYLPCGDHVGRREAERERTAALHAAGVAVTTYFNPMICESYEPAFSAAADAGALTRNAAGEPYIYDYTGSTIFRVGQFDFSAPEGRDFYAALLAEAVEDGHDGWMEDFGEYTPLDSRSADGRTGLETHNPYVTDYHCAVFDFVRRQERPIVRFQRSGWTGAAPCAQVVWNGDPTTDWGFDGLASAVKGALAIGLSGVSLWGSDIGGFFALGTRALTGELLVRWVQLGAVSGVMRTERNGFSLPTKVRPQVEDDDQLPNWRRYTKLRTQLYPYLVAADAEYRRSGLPIMRHLVLAFPDDPQAVGREDEFLFGPDILAAPVLEPEARSREVYLPSGEWVDLWRAAPYDEASGGLVLGPASVVAGGRTITAPAPLDELPLFVRAGAVLPLLPPEVDTLADYGDPEVDLVKLADRADRLELIAFPRGAARARFHDRGRLALREGRGRLDLAVSDVVFRRHRLQAALGTMERPIVPCRVEWQGEPLPADAWHYDAETGVLSAEFEGRRGRLVVRGRCS
jgi:alpha-glucosidase (family GH31 glycosyl hydrolase)